MKDATKNKIINALQNNNRVNSEVDPNVLRGEIRLVSDPDGNLAGRYGVIISINPLRETAKIALINNLTNLATVRDFIASSKSTSAPFDVTIITDGINTVDLMQVRNSPRVGIICKKCVDAVKSQSESLDFANIQSSLITDCLERGHYDIKIGDPVWNLRDAEFLHWNQLCLEIDENFIILREGLKIEKFFDENDFIMNIDSSLSSEIIKNLDSSSLDLIRC